MKVFNVTFWRKVIGADKKELKRVTGVRAKTEVTARGKAFRKICFATRYDHWQFLKVEEVGQHE